MGSLYQPGGLIFATKSGTLVNPSICATVHSNRP
jgi:hypothetical protein